MKRLNADISLAATATVTALFDSCHQLDTEPGDFRLVVCLLGIRQQPFKFMDTLLKVHPLFEIHGYFTLRPSLWAWARYFVPLIAPFS